MASSETELTVAGRPVRISSPEKIVVPSRGLTKLELMEYVVAVSPGLLRATFERPTVMHRFPHGVPAAAGPSGGAGDAARAADAEGFFQKRVGRSPSWIETVSVVFPSGNTADELCPTEPAHLVWAANLGCLEFHPWQVRRSDLLRPDELRFDLDPADGVGFAQVVEVAGVLREVLADAGLVGFPKTTGKRGLHVYVPIQPRWGYLPVRRAVLAAAREVERRAPDLATAAWWKEERGTRVFIDFNQNLPDRTVVAAYSVRPVPEATVSCPLAWDELPDVDPRDLHVESVPARLESVGEPMAAMEDHAQSLDVLLEWVERDERAGLGEAPFPPHFPKVAGEPRRVQPSKARPPE